MNGFISIFFWVLALSILIKDTIQPGVQVELDVAFWSCLIIHVIYKVLAKLDEKQ